jgi:hypothetical protein
MADLVVAPCDARAARYAAKHWHYSGRLPTGRVARYGVWEGDRFVGAVVFAWGANPKVYRRFGLTMYEGAELVRVALRDHEHPVSQIVRSAIRQLKANSPGLRMLVSYADPRFGHHGGIYQAMSWVYIGETSAQNYWQLRDGRIVHTRTYTSLQFGRPTPPKPPGTTRVRLPPKHKYVLGLDRAMRRQLAPLSQPYPRGQGLDGETPDLRSGRPGSTPGDRSMKAAG